VQDIPVQRDLVVLHNTPYFPACKMNEPYLCAVLSVVEILLLLFGLIMYLWMPMIFNLLITLILTRLNVEQANEELREKLS